MDRKKLPTHVSTPQEELDRRWAIIRTRDIKTGRGWIYDNSPKPVTAEEYAEHGIDPTIRVMFPHEWQALTGDSTE